VGLVAGWAVGGGGRFHACQGHRRAPFVTIDLHDLTARCGGGAAMLTCRLLAPETIRRIACDASIIPVVLGTGSEVLDVGPGKRL